jgi:hypothetical protein
MLIKMLLVAAAVGMQDSALVQEVVCAETGFSRAAEVRDREAFLGFIDPDARFLAGGVARGHDEIIAAWDPFLTLGAVDPLAARDGRGLLRRSPGNQPGAIPDDRNRYGRESPGNLGAFHVDVAPSRRRGLAGCI